MGFSAVGFIDALIRRSFATAGLRSTTIDIAGGTTTMHCWVSAALLSNSSPTDAAAPPPPPAQQKPALVLIHGFGPEAMWQWRPQVGPLSCHFDLIIPDLVFFGGSTTRSSDRSVAFQAACIARLLDALAVSGRPPSVVGTSYGGMVAYNLAKSLGPERVGRLVIASSDVLKNKSDDAELKGRAGVESVSDILLPRTAEHFRALLSLCVHRQPWFMPDFLLRDALQNMYNENLEEKMELMKAIDHSEVQVTPLPQEVLVLWGEHDGLFPLEKAHTLKKELGKNAKLEIMKETSHVPQLEDPERFNQLVLDFLLGSSHEAYV